jgi:hypothetical protein
MKTRREEEVIIADGHTERHTCGGRAWALGEGRNRAGAGAQITGIRGFAHVLPPVKRVVFVADGRNFDLLPHEVQVYRRSQQVS